MCARDVLESVLRLERARSKSECVASPSFRGCPVVRMCSASRLRESVARCGPARHAAVSLKLMLHTLHIRNLALIERAELRMADGLTAISGETGGGKSLLITALKLLRGEKAAASLVRHGESELQVDGEFRLGSGAIGARP